jgi:enoyl-[acyl-carrier protein] reductase II
VRRVPARDVRGGGDRMIRTPLCDLLGVDVPVIQAPFGPWPSLELAAAVSNAGGLGSLGTSLRPLDVLRREWTAMLARTDRPFAINHTARPLDEATFAASLEARPRAVSFALGDPGDLVERAHDSGVLFVQQVHTVEQARRVAERGVDVIIAQGSEAGGFGGTIGTLVLVPQVVDAVSPIPVVAAGGIADGRGLAAALVLGAQGVNVGTRFLAAVEAAIDEGWKSAVVAAASDDAVRVEFADAVFPPAGPAGFGTRPRALRTPFIDEWNGRSSDVAAHAGELRDQLLDAVRGGRAHELVPFTGQSAGLVHEVLPVAEILRRLIAEAEEALASVR